MWVVIMRLEWGHHLKYTYIYDPVNPSWSTPLNAPYCQFAMTTLNNNLLIAGGKDNSNRKTDEISMLTTQTDASHDQFNSYTKMNKARSSPAAVGHQGMLITAGARTIGTKYCHLLSYLTVTMNNGTLVIACHNQCTGCNR